MANDQRVEIKTIIIISKNPKELAAFYADNFSLSAPENYMDEHFGLKLPDIYIGFDKIQKRVPHYPGAVSLWFTVADITTVFNRFIKNGAKEKYAPVTKPWGDTLAAVYDPDGNVVGLVQQND